tara:strand:+ start:106 stop:612 length:507 start_codon:yes stop_codon:yes gene_type:complete
MNNDTKFIISISIRRIAELLDSKILWSNDKILIPFKHSVLTEVLVLLNDLLQKSNKFKNRVDFKDDVFIYNHTNKKLKIDDVTDLISNFRNLLCHTNTDRTIATSYLKNLFNLIPKKEILYEFDDVVVQNKYDDDIAYSSGKNVLYLKRHIEKSFYCIKENFKDYILF